MSANVYPYDAKDPKLVDYPFEYENFDIFRGYCSNCFCIDPFGEIVDRHYQIFDLPSSPLKRS